MILRMAGSRSRTASLLGWDGPHAFNITVRVTDQGGLTFDKQFTVGLTKVNSIAYDSTAMAAAIPPVAETLTATCPSGR